MVGKNSSGLPPGFRFHPTDEELIIHYLKNQATSRPCPVSIIPEVDIYKFDPWQLPDKAEFGEKEWYFFTPRDRKYPNGVRPNRAAVSGYWKATGTDKAIYSGSKNVGVKKALVFYRGRPPKGVKTDWIMHEYRLSESRSQPYKQNGSMRLDDWVLCRIYKKKNTLGRSSHDHQQKFEAPISPQITTPIITTTDHTSVDQQQHYYKNIPRAFSLTNLWDFDYMSSISHLLNENPPFNAAEPLNDGGAADYKHQLGQVQQPRADGTKFQVNQTVFVNPSYELQ